MMVPLKILGHLNDFKMNAEKGEVQDFFSKVTKIKNQDCELNEKFLSEEFKEFYYNTSGPKTLFNSPDEQFTDVISSTMRFNKYRQLMDSLGLAGSK